MYRYIRSANNIKSHIILNTPEDVRDLVEKYIDVTCTNFIKHDDMKYHSHIIEIPSDELLYDSYIKEKEEWGVEASLYNSTFLSAVKYWGTPSSYKKIKEHLGKIIHYYDGRDFRTSYDVIEALAEQIKSSKLEPYPISIEVKPASVLIRFRKTQLKNLDLEQINSNIDKYIESLESLPLVGKVYTDHAYIADDFLTGVNLRPYYIKVVPKANVR